MRVSSWLRPLAARLLRSPVPRALHRPAGRPCVERLEDRTVLAIFAVTTTIDSGVGSLRQAMLDANAAPGTDEIRFALPDSLKTPGADWWKIQPTSALPPITDTVALDGWSQGGAGNHGPPRIMLDGSMAGLVDGLQVQANDCLIRGLAVGNFDPTAIAGNSGIKLGTTFSIVQGCYIGLDPSGSVAPNCHGLNDAGIQNLIGGSGPGEGNVISGSRGWQILSRRGATIRGNFIGTDPTGTAVIPNTANGMNVGDVSPTGAPLVVEGNVISGNAGFAILVGTGVQIRGNLIGTDVTGMHAMGNAQGGIFVGVGLAATDVVIGGTGTVNPVANPQSIYDRVMNVTGGDRNVIGAHGGEGILLQASGVLVQGNYIGTDANGGLFPGEPALSTGITAFGGDTVVGNLVAGNGYGGVVLVNSNNLLLGNVIRDNYFAGVEIGITPGSGNTVSQNAIYRNIPNPFQGVGQGSGMGIDIYLDTSDNGGVTLNDPLDADSGPNGLQNFPVLSSAHCGATTGTLNSSPNTTYRIEFFANHEADPSGYGEGERYIGSIEVTTDSAGNAAYNAPLDALYASETYLTATATNLTTGDTSEFSQAIAPPANTAPVAVDDTATTAEDTPVLIDVLANDTDWDHDQLTITNVTTPLHGAVIVTPDGKVLYTPNANFFGTDTFSYTVSDGRGGSDTASVTVTVNNLVDLSGRVFDDLDNDGVFEPGNGETGIAAVGVQLFSESNLSTPLATVLTRADGTYHFNVNLGAGTHRVVAAQPAGYLDGRETAGNIGGTVDNTRDSNAITGIIVGEPGTTPDAIDYLFAEIRPSRLQGMVWEDFNNDAEVNFGEKAISDVVITLTGTDDRGTPVNQTMATTSQGIFEFCDLRPGNYTITEAQPAGFADGRDSLGTVNGVPTGVPTVNDRFSQVILPAPGSDGINYNFGERAPAGGQVHRGQTATIGFWHNNNGQALILALNGGATSTQLGSWLAATFPNMYGVNAGPNNLSGHTNAEVAAFYMELFKRNGQTSPGGPPKLDAQVLATALAVYVTNQNLAGTTAAAYGFQVTANGVGYSTFNVGGNGAAFGVANHTTLTVLDILLATNSRTYHGLLYDLDGSGTISTSERALREMANAVYSAINEQGDI